MIGTDDKQPKVGMHMLAKKNAVPAYLASEAVAQREFEPDFKIKKMSIAAFANTLLGSNAEQINNLFLSRGGVFETKYSFIIERSENGGIRLSVPGEKGNVHLFDLRAGSGEFLRISPFSVSDLAISFPSQEAFAHALELLPELNAMLQSQKSKKSEQQDAVAIDEKALEREKAALNKLDGLIKEYDDCERSNRMWIVRFDGTEKVDPSYSWTVLNVRKYAKDLLNGMNGAIKTPENCIRYLADKGRLFASVSAESYLQGLPSSEPFKERIRRMDVKEANERIADATKEVDATKEQVANKLKELNNIIVKYDAGIVRIEKSISDFKEYVAALVMQAKPDFKFDVYPNPINAGSKLSVKATVPINAHMRLVDADNGKIISEKQVSLDAGTAQIPIGDMIRNGMRGAYLLNVKFDIRENLFGQSAASDPAGYMEWLSDVFGFKLTNNNISISVQKQE